MRLQTVFSEFAFYGGKIDGHIWPSLLFIWWLLGISSVSQPCPMGLPVCFAPCEEKEGSKTR